MGICVGDDEAQGLGLSMKAPRTARDEAIVIMRRIRNVLRNEFSPRIMPWTVIDPRELAADELTPTQPNRTPPVLWDTERNRPLQRAECGICLDNPVEIRTRAVLVVLAITAWFH